METNCPKCHVVVRPTDYFCYNCGKNLKPAPPTTDTASQIALYAKSILLPPFGIYWALTYLKEKEAKPRIIGVIAIVLTLVSLLIGFIALKNLSDTVNQQMSRQLNSINNY